MSFDKIFDLTAGVYFNFYNIYRSIAVLLYRSFIRKKAYFSDTQHPNQTLRKPRGVSTKINTPILKKRQTSLDASARQKAGWTLTKSGSDSPGPPVKHACEGAKTSTFRFQNQLL